MISLTYCIAAYISGYLKPHNLQKRTKPYGLQRKEIITISSVAKPSSFFFVRDEDAELTQVRFRVILCYLFPVDYIPPCFDIRSPIPVVLDVVRVLPHVEAENGSEAEREG